MKTPPSLRRRGLAPTLRFAPLTLLIALLGAGAGSAEAAVRNWSYNQPNWSDTGAWNGVFQTGDSVVFTGGPGSSHNDIASPFSIAGIRFTSSAGAHELTGNGVSLSGAVLHESSAAQEIGLDLTFSAHQITTVTAPTAELLFSGALSGGFNFTKRGAGTAIFAGANSYTGATAIEAGTLRLDFSSLPAADPINIIAPTSAVTLTGGTLEIKGKSSGISTQTLSSLLITSGGGGRIALDSNGGAGTQLSIGTLTRATSSLRGGTTLAVSLGGVSGITVNNAPTLSHGIYGYATVRDGGGVGFATISGNQLVRYTGAAPLPGDGSSSATGHYALNGSSSTSAASAIHSLEMTSNSPDSGLALGGNLTITAGGGLLLSGSHSYTISGHAIRNSAVTDSISFHTEGTGDLQIDSNVEALTSSQWAKAGAGRLILAGSANSIYNNPTAGIARFSINEGVVQLNENFEGMHFIVDTDDALQFGHNATAITVGAVAHNTASTPRRIGLETVTGQAVTLTLGRGSANFNGSFYGTGGINITDGIHSFGGLHTYSGGTVIDGPTAILAIQPTNSLSTSGSIEIRNGGQLGNTSFRINQTTTGDLRIVNGRITSVSGGVITKNGGSYEFHEGNVDANTSLRGSAGVVKRSGGIFTIGGASQYTGATVIEAGTLIINGSIAASSGVEVQSGGTLAGHGQTAAITGAGRISPGNSPGILTAPSVDGSMGLDFTFEFTQATASGVSVPIFGNAAASGNDLLRLTAASPFLSALHAGNEITLDFTGLANAPIAGEIYLGGFYSDLSDFSSLIADATWVTIGLDPGLQVLVSTLQYDANFGGGVMQGFITQFELEAIPEPGAFSLALLGSLLGISVARKRRRL